jgi:hypothetical protein
MSIQDFKNHYDKFVEFIKPNLRERYEHYVKLTPENALKKFIYYLLPQMEDISLRNLDLFMTSKVKCFDGVKFKDVLKDTSRETQDQFWKLIQVLYIKALATKQVKDLIPDAFVNGTDQERELIEKARINLENQTDILTNFVNGSENYVSSAEYRQELEKKLKKKMKKAREKKSNNQGMFPPGGMPNLGNLGGLGNIGKMAEKLGNMMNQGSGEEGNEGEASGDGGFLDNSMIGNLAKQLTKEINLDELGDLDMSNPADLMSSLFSGGDNNPIGNIMNKVVSSIDEKMKSGELNQDELVKEANNVMNMMSNTDTHGKETEASK